MPRFIATFNVPDDVDPQDVAIWFDCDMPWKFRLMPDGAERGNPVDSTVYRSEDDYLSDLAEMVCRTGKCWRCSNEVTEQFDRIALDAAQMNTCPASDEFDMPHEIDPPDGWDDE